MPTKLTVIVFNSELIRGPSAVNQAVVQTYSATCARLAIWLQVRQVTAGLLDFTLDLIHAFILFHFCNLYLPGGVPFGESNHIPA